MLQCKNIIKTTVALLAAATIFSCFGATGGKKGGETSTGTTVARQGGGLPVRYNYTVINTYPHNDRSYTQGLYWHDGYLWEGTGQYGESALKKVDLETGTVMSELPLDSGYFGEGIALTGGKIYQLTWLEGTCLVYDGQSLELLDKIEYAGQGWGLTTDGELLYMSNGSHEIQVIEPDGFKRKRTIRVSVGNRRLTQLNELEWIEGRIWANIYGSDQIAVIDPASGVVEGLVDMQGLLPVSERTPRTDVLNGIAYDDATGRIFVTGKNWPTLYEIEIKEK